METAMGRKPADKVGIIVRLSEALRRRIEKTAQKNNQSMNLEIVRRLEESFRKDDTRAERLEDRRELVGHFDRVIRYLSAKQLNLTETQKAELDHFLDDQQRERDDK